MSSRTGECVTCTYGANLEKKKLVVPLCEYSACEEHCTQMHHGGQHIRWDGTMKHPPSDKPEFGLVTETSKPKAIKVTDWRGGSIPLLEDLT